MRKLDSNFENNIRDNGFHIQKNFFENTFLNKVNDISNKIIKFEKKLNLVGLGNQSSRNGNIFTGDLILKNDVFSDILLNYDLLKIPETLLKKFNLSEYKVISSYKFSDSKYWWHRDHPFYDFNQTDDINIGILIPLIDFNKEVGSTVFIPKSHKLSRKPENLIETESFSNQEYLETKLGDIFIYDGKLIHSGSPNNIDKIRSLVSIQFVKKYVIPCENMKLQYTQSNKKNNKLFSLMYDYHDQHINKFGSNRNWVHTKYWKILKYFDFMIKFSKESYFKIQKKIYHFVSK